MLKTLALASIIPTAAGLFLMYKDIQHQKILSETRIRLYLQCPSPITREQLLSGEIGIHKLEEPLVGYKKVNCYDNGLHTGSVIVTVTAPKNANVISGTDSDCFGNKYSPKYRTDKFIITEIEGPISPFITYCSIFDGNFIYQKGLLYENNLKMSHERCASGLHFFRDLKDARDYN